MNNDLKERLMKCYNAIVTECELLKKEFYETSSKERKEEINSRVSNLYKLRNSFAVEIKYFDAVKRSNNKELINQYIKESYDMINYYNLHYGFTTNDDKKNTRVVTKEEKIKPIPFFLAAGFIFGLTGGFVVNSAMKNNTATYEASQSNYQSNNSNSNDLLLNQSVDFEKYGMSSHLTDASDDEQVMQRAQDIYNKYVNLSDVRSNYKQQLTVENIANTIRVFNGEFPKKNGVEYYNSTNIGDQFPNYLNSYLNSSSFHDLGSNLRFTPLSLFFEEDTLAHEVASQADVLMSNIYEDIRNNNTEKYVKDSIEWGKFVNGTVIRNDYSSNYISIWDVEDEQAFFLLNGITVSYVPSIMEYGSYAYNNNCEHFIRNNDTVEFGESNGLKIPNCYKQGNEIELSNLLRDINYTPATKINNNQQGDSYDNSSIIDQLLDKSVSWFNDKYDREIGYSKRLK